MTESFKTAVNQRFILVSKTLIRNAKTKNITDFCNKMEIHPQVYNDIKNNRRGVTLEMLFNLYKLFAISPMYMLDELGDMFILFKQENIGNETVSEPVAPYFTMSTKLGISGKIDEIEKSIMNASTLLKSIRKDVMEAKSN